MVDRLSDRSRSLGHHRWLDLRFHRDSELSVPSHIVCGPVNAVGYRMAVGSIQREGHILIDAAALGTVLVGPSDHGALHSHHSHAALVVGRVTAVCVQTAASIRFIKTAVWVVRLHGMALFGADAVDLRHKYCLVIVAAEGSGLVVLN